MVPVVTHKITTNFLIKGIPFLKDQPKKNQRKSKGKKHKDSFSSGSSFSSFGSMDENQAILIVNPNEYTVSNREWGINLISS